MKKELQKLIKQVKNVDMRRKIKVVHASETKMKVNVNKSMVMVFKKEKSEVNNFGDHCRLRMNGQIMEEVKVQHFGLIVCKQGNLERDKNEYFTGRKR